MPHRLNDRFNASARDIGRFEYEGLGERPTGDGRMEVIARFTNYYENNHGHIVPQPVERNAEQLTSDLMREIGENEPMTAHNLADIKRALSDISDVTNGRAPDAVADKLRELQAQESRAPAMTQQMAASPNTFL